MTAPVHPPLSFKQALLAMLGISLVLMLSALDQTVIGNALRLNAGADHFDAPSLSPATNPEGQLR